MRSLLGLVILVLDILAILEILKSRQEGLKKALWIAIIVVLPFVGLLLWWFLGRGKR